MKKYLVIEVEEYCEGFEVMQHFYTKEEIYEEYYGLYVEYDDSYYPVKDEEQGYELLKDAFEYEFDDIFEFLEKYGSLEKWKEEMKHNNFHYRLDPRLEIYEVCENGLKHIDKL
jgi:hypothetical protein